MFPWNKNFETGIEIVDKQHKKLISLLNKLAETLVQDNHLESNRVFDELTDYANNHFETEEAIWIEYFEQDSWLSSHHSAHISFLPKVIELREQGTNQSNYEIIENILEFLIQWLAFHIIDTDRRMALVTQNMQHKEKSLEEAKCISEIEMNRSAKLLTNTILTMYAQLSSRSLDLLREKRQHQDTEQELNKTNLQLRKINTKLKNLAITDQLTGLFNRRHFISVFKRELKRAYREKNCLSLIMLDIDLFKKINNDYGHSEGDRVLTQVSKKLKSFCQRPTDYVFRLGGEEFSILAANLDQQGTIEFAEIIRKGIEQLNISNKSNDIIEALTVSIGTITKIPDNTDTIDKYMSIADMRLYKAKTLGRNRVISSD